MERVKIKKMHIFVIVIGIIFNCVSIFHPNLWFDEAYSVGLASKSFSDIWKIGGNDVHPVLYYWILHIIYIITNGSIIAYRVFSAFCIALLGVLGFTHIRKDFGEKVGLLFSFFSYFLPVICTYTAEVRMYSLAILLVTILAIYAYRLYKDDSSNKNWIIFGISSLACIYVHYYGLMAAGIINCVLLFYLIKQQRKTAIVKILTSGLIQLVAYIPWIMYFMKQVKNVSKGFWIGFEFPKTIFQLLGSQFGGNLKEIIGFAVTIVMFAYLIHKVIQTKKAGEDYKIGIVSIAIYVSVIIAAVLITILMRTSILLYRYLFVITGLYIFFMSYFISKEKNKYIIAVICLITVALGTWSNYKQIKEAYDKSNMTQIEYLRENIQPNDIIVFGESSFGAGTVVSLYFTDNTQIYYNPQNWGVEEAYKAFGNQLQVRTDTAFMNEYTGRIWIIDSENGDCYNELYNNDNYNTISKKLINTRYEDYKYNIILVENVQ